MSVSKNGKVKAMLLWFSCENCYSFAEKATLSMSASDKWGTDRLLYEQNNKYILSVASIYGSNSTRVKFQLSSVVTPV